MKKPHLLVDNNKTVWFLNVDKRLNQISTLLDALISMSFS